MSRCSSVGRASDRRSEGPWFAPRRRHYFFLLFLFEIAYKKFLKSKLTSKRVRSSVVEHGIADPAVTGSTPVVP